MTREAVIGGLMLALGATAWAQPAPVVGTAVSTGAGSAIQPSTRDASQARYQLRLMESVLESAVQHGAQMVSSDIRRLSPELMVFTGPARARGFKLDGYGVFFSVDVPAVRRSVVWSVRTLTQNGMELSRALDSLRRLVQTQGDPRAKTEFEQALKLVELQVGPVAPPGRADMRAAPEAAAAALADGNRMAPMRDPNASYEDEVKKALIDAMLDYGNTMNVAGDEWLTIAARDTGDQGLSGDLAESVTVTLRLRGSDLTAYRAGQISKDDARRRVEVREF